MPHPENPGDEPRTGVTVTKGRTDPRSEPIEEEKKILLGRQDVNMPALLTRDVPGD
jgi:hypothetical protein